MLPSLLRPCDWSQESRQEMQCGRSVDTDLDDFDPSQIFSLSQPQFILYQQVDDGMHCFPNVYTIAVETD